MYIINQKVCIILCFSGMVSSLFGMNTLTPLFSLKNFTCPKEKAPLALSFVRKAKKKAIENLDTSMDELKYSLDTIKLIQQYLDGKKDMPKKVSFDHCNKIKENQKLKIKKYLYRDFKINKFLFNILEAVESKNIYEQKILEPIVRNLDIFKNILFSIDANHVFFSDCSHRGVRRLNVFYNDYCSIKQINPNIYNIMAKQSQNKFQDSLESYVKKCNARHRKQVFNCQPRDHDRFVHNM